MKLLRPFSKIMISDISPKKYLEIYIYIYQSKTEFVDTRFCKLQTNVYIYIYILTETEREREIMSEE